MASLLYNSAIAKMANGFINFGTADLKCLLVTSFYKPDKLTHYHRSDVTSEVIAAGYTLGGTQAAIEFIDDLERNRLDIILGEVSWPTSTITAGGAVYYISRGGTAFQDDLVAYVGFSSDVISINGPFFISESIIRIQLQN